VVGCGYVADFYASAHRAKVPEVDLVGAVDLDGERSASFTAAYGGRNYERLSELLADPAVDVVLNLTPPRMHHSVSAAALHAGKHVYSEKPLASSLSAGRELLALARAKGLALGCAPSVDGSIVGRRVRELVANGALGKVSHLYVDIDDGPLHRMNPESWRSDRGVPWPYHDEFADGPVVHHLPYAVAWAVSVAGTALEVIGMTRQAVNRQKLGVVAGPDLCMLLIRHQSGCISRLTVGALAPRNRGLVVVGSDHTAVVPDLWATDGPIVVDGSPVLEPAGKWPFETTHRLDFATGLRTLIGHTRSPQDAVTYTDRWGGVALHILEICAPYHQIGTHVLSSDLLITGQEYSVWLTGPDAATP